MMKMGRISILIVSLLLALWGNVPVTAEESQTAPETFDIQDTKYEQPLATLHAFDVMLTYKEDTYNPNQTVTRGEFANAVAGLLTNIGTDEIVIFQDVPAESELSKNLTKLYGRGVISGTGKWTFAPDDAITYPEAVKMLVAALGYRHLAEQLGGFPYGYLQAANKIGLEIDTKNKQGNELTLGEMTLLLYKALDIEVPQMKTVGPTVSFVTTPGETLLYKERGIYKARGFVDGNEYTMTNRKNTSFKKDIISIDGEEMETDFVSANQYLGYNVIYYYKADKGDSKRLVYLYPDKARTNVIDIPAPMISEATTKNTIYYWVDDYMDRQAWKADISSTANVIYNGVYCGKVHLLEEKYIKPKVGSLKLIDNDTDGLYDIISVESYETVFVDSALKSDEIIVDKYTGKTYKLDTISDGIRPVILLGGEIVDFSSIGKGSVVAVAKTVAGCIMRVLILEDAVTGEVSEISDNDVVIDGIRYTIAESYLEAVRAGAKDAKEIRVGTSAAFYLDYNGHIAAVGDAQKTDKYGYLVTYASSALGKVEFKMFGDDGKMHILNTAKKINVDGQSLTPSETVQYLANNKITGSTAVAYKVNGAGELSFLDTPVLGANETADSSLTLTNPLTKRMYRDYTQGFIFRNGEGDESCGEFFLQNDTIIFSIPPDETADDEYKMIKSGSFQKDSFYLMEGYNASELGKVKLAVLKVDELNSSIVEEDNEIGLVTKITKAYDEKLGAIKKIYMLYQGQEVGYLTSDKLKTTKYLLYPSTVGSNVAKVEQIPFSEIIPGSIVHFSLDSTGKINEVRKITPQENGLSFKEQHSWITRRQMYEEKIYGTVVARDNDTFKINANGTDYLYRIPSGTTTYIFDTKTGEASLGSTDDIIGSETNGSQIFVIVRNVQVRAVVVYKFETEE